MSADDALMHCADELRQHDADRYLVTTLLPPPARRIALALFALDLELARIPEAVTERALGEIRLQFWRDTLTGLNEGAVAAHPVAQAIAVALGEDVPLPTLLALVDARGRDLDDAPPKNMAELVQSGAMTAGALNVLLLMFLGVKDPAVAQAARAAGTGWRLVWLMRDLPRALARRRLPIPDEVLSQLAVDREATFAGHFTPELGKAVSAVVTEAEMHLSEARKTPLPKPARPVFATVLLAVRDAKALQKTNGNPFGLKPPGPLSRQLTMALSVLTGKKG
jgi:phytoene synthase